MSRDFLELCLSILVPKLTIDSRSQSEPESLINNWLERTTVKVKAHRMAENEPNIVQYTETM